jgi:hypothetical protein
MLRIRVLDDGGDCALTTRAIDYTEAMLRRPPVLLACVVCASCLRDGQCPEDRPFEGNRGAWLGSACPNPNWGVPWEDGFDTGFDTRDILLIDSFSYTCTPGAGWRYEFATSAEALEGYLIVDQDTETPWHEEHALPGGTFMTVDLETVSVPEEQVNGSTTLFACADDRRMVWRVEAYDLGGMLADCVVWSGSNTDPSAIWGVDVGGCANGNSW